MCMELTYGACSPLSFHLILCLRQNLRLTKLANCKYLIISHSHQVTFLDHIFYVALQNHHCQIFLLCIGAVVKYGITNVYSLRYNPIDNNNINFPFPQKQMLFIFLLLAQTESLMTGLLRISEKKVAEIIFGCVCNFSCS